MDTMNDLTGLTHPTFGRKKMAMPPWMKKKGDKEEMAEKKGCKCPGIGQAIKGKKTPPAKKIR